MELVYFLFLTFTGCHFVVYNLYYMKWDTLCGLNRVILCGIKPTEIHGFNCNSYL